MRDWAAVQTDYLRGASLGELSRKYGIPKSTIHSKAKTEAWGTPEAVREAIAQKSVEKIAEAVADEEAMIARIKAATRRRLWEVVQHRAERLDDDTDAQDVRRCVQNFVDLLAADPMTDAEETESSGLIEALSNQGEIFAEGDDTEFLEGGAAT